MKSLYLTSPAEWRAWLESHHTTRDEIWVGFHKRATGAPSLTWSLVNTKRVAQLKKEELMCPAGLRAFEARTTSGVYSYEQRRSASLGAAFEKRLKADPAAWEYFQAQPPWYQRMASRWVISAKREETKLKRLEALSSSSSAGRRIGPVTRT